MSSGAGIRRFADAERIPLVCPTLSWTGQQVENFTAKVQLSGWICPYCAGMGQDAECR